MLEPVIASADFSRESGRIRKSLHGSNAVPRMSNRNIYDFGPMYADMKFTASRTHDWALWNPGQRIVDTHFLFPLPKADPADPANYYFDATDEYFAQCAELGTEVFYRLGTSIEHTKGKHFNALMPEDFERYAEVLAGIVRHYTRGWADGFHYDIRYWEIWNEADLGPQMWSGTLAQFEEFFAIVLKRLKNEFPELKIGGPAYCWFAPEKFESLLAACKRREVAPDFISWHCYTTDADNLIAQPAKARAFLDERGFRDTELCINEWHYVLTWEGLHSKVTEESFKRATLGSTGVFGIDSAAFNLAVLSGWHDTPLDSAFYYGAGEVGTWGFRTPMMGWNKNYYSMKMFGEIVTEYPIRIETASSCNSVYLLGALSEDRRRGCLLVTDYRGERNALVVAVSGMAGAEVSAVLLDDANDLAPVPVKQAGETLILHKNGNGSAAFLLSFRR